MYSHELASVILYEGPNPKSIMEISGHRWQRCHESKIQKSRLCFLCFGVGKRKYEITDLLWGSVIVWPDNNQTCSEFKSWFSLSVSNRRGLLKLRLLYFLLSWHPFKSDNIDITSWFMILEYRTDERLLGPWHPTCPTRLNDAICTTIIAELGENERGIVGPMHKSKNGAEKHSTSLPSVTCASLAILLWLTTFANTGLLMRWQIETRSCVGIVAFFSRVNDTVQASIQAHLPNDPTLLGNINSTKLQTPKIISAN